LQDNTFGGLDTNSATALLASITPATDTGGLQGFDSGVSATASLAIAAYQAQQAYPVSSPAVQGSPSSTPTSTLADTSTQPQALAPASTGTASPQDPATNASVQQALQASLTPAVLSLLA
jgi:hypothetical protein